MNLVSHPTGNTFVRALISSIQGHGQEVQFHTTLAFSYRSAWFKGLPNALQRVLSRRAYDLPPDHCHQNPVRELARLAFTRLLNPSWIDRRLPCLTPRAIYRQLDLEVARYIRDANEPIQTLHAYEDGAQHSFRAAAQRGVRRIYHLPIAYWQTSQRILREEIERWPQWAPTLGMDLSNCQVEDQKTEELELASDVICPSNFVLRTLPEEILATKRCWVAPFGSPPPEETRRVPGRGPLRVLFAGSFTQRKGLADLFAAFQQLNRPDVELVLAGSPIMPLDFYQRQYPGFRYERPRSHLEFLKIMDQCDLLALPSLVEGRALVQQEAMSRGLPILITPNTGGEDLVEPGTGFLVPIRQPRRIAEHIDWLADHRAELPEMRQLARAKAAQYSWRNYGDTILEHADALGMASR